MNCTCSKASTENTASGARCSCLKRAAGECTCDRAATENAGVDGKACACGKRGADACTCERNESLAGGQGLETDFTGKA